MKWNSSEYIDACMAPGDAARREPESADTGKDLNSSSNGNNVITEGPPAWFGQWVESGKHYDQHPGNETCEFYPTAAGNVYEWKLKDGNGTIIKSGTVAKH